MRCERVRVWYFNPYLQLAVTAVLVTAAEIFLKKGAVLSHGANLGGLLGLDALAFGATWLGIAFHIAAFLSWLAVLRLMPLVEAFALINIVHVLVPLASSVFLKETLSAAQLIGIMLVLTGTYFVAAAAARGEDKL
jgi:drug/metabolite transporter (DMT)-like permease